MNIKLKYILVLSLLLLLMFISGCEQKGPQGDIIDNKTNEVKVENKTNITNNNEKTENIIIYFPNEDATALIPEVRSIKKGTDDVLIASINDLLSGTKKDGSVNIIPKGTKFYGLEVKNKIAYVNFSKELIKNFNGGSTGEIFLVGSIVNTLTEFPEVTSVRFMVEGKSVDTIAGHMDLTEPIKRMDNIINKK